jgi:hypothetical protein
MEEKYELWLIREEEKRMITCASSWQRAGCATDEKEYLRWRERGRVGL